MKRLGLSLILLGAMSGAGFAADTPPPGTAKSAKEISPVRQDLVAPPSHLVDPPKEDMPEGRPLNVLEEDMTDDEIFLELIVIPSAEDLKPVSPKRNMREDGPRFEWSVDGEALPVTPEARIHEMVPDNLYRYFDLYLYVNKAASGLWAQQMFVYETKDKPGDLALAQRLSASTGREKEERYFTGTPTGLFMLDPTRFYRDKRSWQWDGVRIPFAMFFDYSYRTRKSGYAIHAAIPEFEKYLGQRASAGCVRLSMKHGEALFDRVQSSYGGQVPVFPFDNKVGLTKTDGTIKRDAKGNAVLQEGYRVLVLIDDTVVRTGQ